VHSQAHYAWMAGKPEVTSELPTCTRTTRNRFPPVIGPFVWLFLVFAPGHVATPVTHFISFEVGNLIETP
jgi:hypothetical protein